MIRSELLAACFIWHCGDQDCTTTTHHNFGSMRVERDARISSSGTFDLANATPVQSGSASVAVSFSGAWAGSLTFKTFANPVTVYDSLRFWVHGGASGANFTFYAQSAAGSNSPFIDLVAPANTWTEFVITKAQLGNLSDLARLDWSANGSSTSATFFVDNVRAATAGAATSTPTPIPTATSTATPTSTPTQTPTPSGTETMIYADALANDWLNWSSNGTFNLANATPVQSGSASVAVSFSGAWSGSLTFKTFVNPVTVYDSLRFWVHGGASGASFTVYAQNAAGTNSPFIDLVAPANVWTEFVITKAQLGNLSDLARLDWSANGNSTSATFYVDNVRAVATVGLGGRKVWAAPAQQAVPPSVCAKFGFAGQDCTATTYYQFGSQRVAMRVERDASNSVYW